MEQNSTSTRLHALDGIRGIAIILVILNHINPTFLGSLFPQLINNILYSSGITGVSLLFILSGFFMAFIYPHPTSGLHFLQKRYTRIFPLFLTMCSVMVTLRGMPNLPWYYQIIVILGFATFSHILWVYLIKKYATYSLRKLMFFCFLILQVVVGCLYLFVVMRYPAIVFNQQISPFSRESMIGLVNATLTLPLGNYIPMLDGVYWSLVAEVLFYILYPFLCVPIILFLQKQKRSAKIIFLLLLLPFFAGLDILAHRLLVLSMLQVYLCYYFVIGIVMGYLYRNKSVWVESLGMIFVGKWYLLSLLFFFIVIFGKTLSFNFVYHPLDPLVHMVWGFPIAYVLLLAMSHRTSLSKFLSTKPLVYLGTISYSVYLLHSTVIHMMQNAVGVVNLQTNLLALLLIFIITFILASILYQLLEKPYFQKEKVSEHSIQQSPKKFTMYLQRPGVILLYVTIFYLFVIFSSYQGNFNFFSQEYAFERTVFLQPTLNQQMTMLSMKQYPQVLLQLTATQDNWAVLTMHIVPQMLDTKNATNNHLVFRIKQVGAVDWLATNTYDVTKITSSGEFPFGFPLQIDAKGKTYEVMLSLKDPSSPEYINIDTTKIKGVYQVDKKFLFTHPLQLISFIGARIMNVMYTPDAQLTLVLFLPFASYFVYLLIPRRTAD